jgi:hypothetical protein
MKYVGPHEALRVVQHGLFVDEVPADYVVLGILPVADEGPDLVDHPLGLYGLPLPVRQGPQALQLLEVREDEVEQRRPWVGNGTCRTPTASASEISPYKIKNAARSSA